MALAIKQLRKKLHISQTDFAKRVGVSLRTVGSWERGESMPNAEQIWNIAIALDCTPNDVLGWYEDHPEDAITTVLTIDEHEIIDCYRDSSPQWKMNISMTARAASGESKKKTKHNLSAATEREAI